MMSIPISKVQGSLVQGVLDFIQQLPDGPADPFERHPALSLATRSVASSYHDLVVGQIAWSELNPYGNPLHFPLVEFESGSYLFSIIQDRPDARFDQFITHPNSRLDHGLTLFGIRPGNRHDDHLVGGYPRRKDQTLVVSMGHDDHTDQPGTSPP